MRSLLVPITAVLLTLCVQAQPATRPTDAWPLYQQAAARIREGDHQGLSSPSSSSFPFGFLSNEWKDQERKVYAFNADALRQVHEAAALDHADWPVERHGNDVSLKYLSEMRNVANEVTDAALLDHAQENDVLALSRCQDVLHIADLLDQPKDELIVQALVAAGLRSISFSRLEMISAELHLTNDPKGDGPSAVPAETVRVVIRQIFAGKDPADRLHEMIDQERALNPAYVIDADSKERIEKSLHRDQMERNLAAMSLACQVFHFEKSRWPASLDELLPYLPAEPADFWGPMGYVLIKSKDGPDRPLVYSRYGAAPGQTLAYPARDPWYQYYNRGSLGIPDQPIPGQFRDVSPWVLPQGQLAPDVLHPLK